MNRFEVTRAKAKKEGYPEPVWWAKAARQFGLQTDIEQVQEGESVIDVLVRLPVLSPSAFRGVRERAELLAARAAQGLPTEEKPSGGFPDSDNEVDPPIALMVRPEGDKVVIDLGRPVRAFTIHPVSASYLASLLTQASFEASGGSVDPDDTTIRVAHVKGVDGNVREAVIRLGDPFVEGGEKGEDMTDLSRVFGEES